MHIFHVVFALMFCITPSLSISKPAATTSGALAGVIAFNHAFETASRHMDNAATLALWENNGVSLLPSTPPIIGKPALTKFMTKVMANLHGAHMKVFESSCHDIHVSGDWSTEWCDEHQFVEFASGKPAFEGWGKMLLVLHRDSNGRWHLHTEMWNQALPVTKVTEQAS